MLSASIFICIAFIIFKQFRKYLQKMKLLPFIKLLLILTVIIISCTKKVKDILFVNIVATMSIFILKNVPLLNNLKNNLKK